MLFLSIHIPKTAGSSMLAALRARYGDGLALYYGATDQRTHPAIRCPQDEITERHITALEDDGIQVVHGHMRPKFLLEAVPDPARYWIWLREPIAHALSFYHFSEGRQPTGRTFFKFLDEPTNQNTQTPFVRGLDLTQTGFVGITEHFFTMLPMLGLQPVGGGRLNVTPNKPMADRRTRLYAAKRLQKDFALYSEAMEIALQRRAAFIAKASAQRTGEVSVSGEEVAP
ncbi:MAG: hypothetical protein AAGB11_05560 [Pseudomonadota bacterium]